MVGLHSQSGGVTPCIYKALSPAVWSSVPQQQSTCQHEIDTIVNMLHHLDIMFWIFVTINYIIVTTRVYICS